MNNKNIAPQDLIPIINFNQDLNENKNSFIEEIYDISLGDKVNALNFKYANPNSKLAIKFKIFEDLMESFNKIYDQNVSFISRAPGRVNIIGEHIDYAGFSVLPMAIENDILIACSVEKSEKENPLMQEELKIEINHVNPDKYPKIVLQPLTSGESSYFGIEFIKPHSWVNYIIAGINAIKCGLNIPYDQINSQKIKKINLLVTGNIPCASGLSSSSALTVASALAALKFFDLTKNFTKFEIAKATIDYERSVGTACGGMDQTISICAEKGQAKLVIFTPELNTKTCKLPNNVSFVIANSMTQSTKIDTLAFRYNKRVVENKFGLAIIAKNLKLDFLPRTLIDLKNNYPQKNQEINFQELNKLIENNLKTGNYSIEEINEIFGEEIKEILANVPYYEDVLAKNKDFALKNRLLHVCQEAERVEEFYNLCNQENPEVNKLGKLMNDSHNSCRDLYECSSKELDNLVSFALEKGAIGARLTGAGWGGCAVIMCNNNEVESILENLRKYYTEKFNVEFGNGNIDEGEYFFYTKPSRGACVIN